MRTSKNPRFQILPKQKQRRAGRIAARQELRQARKMHKTLNKFAFTRSRDEDATGRGA